MASTANRGKSAEKQVADRLAFLCQRQDQTFHRLPDARSGSLMPTIADFLYMNAGALALIEVKEVDHKERLPYKNFGIDQVARMRTWKMAGAQAIVLIHHKPLGLWRGYDVEHFIHRETGSGSWVLTNTPTTLADLLD